MFSLFKRRRAPETLTYKSRVAEFWVWFAKNAQRFYDTIEDKRCADLQPEVSAQMNRLIPGAAWIFGPGANDVGHSFTFTAEGNRHHQLLTTYWQNHAPSLPGWTFYAFKQRDLAVGGYQIRFDDLTLDPKEFWVVPYVDESAEKIELTAWHPAFAQVDERTRWTAIFLYLDEALGELCTQSCIGEIKVGDGRLTDAIPLKELPSYVDAAIQKHDWQLDRPGELWTSYQRKDPEQGNLRSDIIAGSTSAFFLVKNVKDGHVEADPLDGTGAEYVYVAFARSALTHGDEVTSRGLIEDALTAGLAPSASGMVLGGALGLDRAYIDLLLYDGNDSLKIVEKVLRQQRLGQGASIEYFARSRAADRVAI